MTHIGSVNCRDDNSPGQHIPVLSKPLIEKICIPKDGIFADATIGHGGHSWLFGQNLGPEGMILGMDVDPKCIERAHQKLTALPCRKILLRENFSMITETFRQHQVEQADVILADLGFCSAQLDDSKRGFSFQTDMPLDMRLDDRLPQTATDLVNRLDQNDLADLIFKYGEDRGSRRIARFIVEHRKRQKISTTAQLAAIVVKALARPGKTGRWRIHPATRTFQALRIAVNRELENLESFLRKIPDVLKPGGTLAVISFHSLEDRLVKYNFRDNKSNGIYKILTKKPIEADSDEVTANPRSRSAKLRIAVKL